MYTPTKEELEELGFKRSEWNPGMVIYRTKTFSHWQIYIQYRNFWCPEIYLVDQDNDFEQSAHIYPRSREHLEQIILAFKPE